MRLVSFAGLCYDISHSLISELVITSGRKKIAPVPIEDAIKEKAPFLNNVMVVGDHRKYISCLVTLKVR